MAHRHYGTMAPPALDSRRSTRMLTTGTKLAPADSQASESECADAHTSQQAEPHNLSASSFELAEAAPTAIEQLPFQVNASVARDQLVSF
jgi:hypothetical protein